MKNFEKYKTVDERVDAHDEYCMKNYKCKNPNADTCVECFAQWLELEAEGKPLPCPFCRRETMPKHLAGGFCVECDCGYTGQFAETEAEAIDAHNRVTSAVMSEKGSEVRDGK